MIDYVGWDIREHELVLEIVVAGELAGWSIPLDTLGDAIKAAQEARDGQRAKKPYPTTQET